MPLFTIKEIFPLVPTCRFLGDENQEIVGLANFESEDSENKLMWLSDQMARNENCELLNRAGAVILTETAYNLLKQKPQNVLFVEDPRAAFQQVIQHFFNRSWQPKIEASAIIYPGVNIPNTCYIGYGVVIEEGVVLGEYAYIGHNTVIHSETRIGNRVKIGANNTIGGNGFGYVKVENGTFQQFAHLGNVIIEDEVTIHNNTCIDRAVIGATRIGYGVKIDNLVHIAHGVQIGANSVVIANSMIAGSTKVGENCWIAPSASILNKLEIASNSTIGMGAVVLKKVGHNKVIIGNPGREKE